MTDLHATLPFKYEDMDFGSDYGDIQFYNVLWTEDFGVFRKGDIFQCLAYLDSKGEIECYTIDDAGEIVKTIKQKIKIIPN